MKRILSVLFVLSMILGSTSAMAQQKGKKSQVDKEESIEARHKRIAEEHFKNSRDWYARGEYQKALDELEAAQKAFDTPLMWYNKGECLERMQRWADAIAAFDQFLKLAPDDEQADNIRARIATLQAHLPPAAPAKVPPAPTPDPSPGITDVDDVPQPNPAPAKAKEPPVTPVMTPVPPVAAPAPAPITPAPPVVVQPKHDVVPVIAPTKSRLSYTAPLALGVVSLAVFGGGAGLYASGRQDYNHLVGLMCAPACNPSAAGTIQLREQLGVAGMSIGGAALAADVVLWILYGKGRAGANPESRPHAIIVPFGQGAALVGSFN